ncbi:7013_t:CDS:2 [Funneliformis caledonium]|uniref:7013_t:CDS:1 n=1 Tax=Funneliformis caledonium TaxID=1117310 RepID=A0A9N9DKE2_9GLOM|nr:7013_t:CDS:2 [Funneliformis caledonium]
MGRHTKNQPSKNNVQNGATAISTYEKYKEIKLKYMELKKVNQELNEEYGRAIKTVRKCKEERDSLLDKLSTTYIKNESTSTKDHQRRQNDASAAHNVKSAAHAARNIVNDVPVTSSKRGPGRPPASSRNVKAYHVDKDENGNYILPVEVGLHTILDLGTVVFDRSAYHNDRYIYPVGYSTQRPYLSMIDPTRETTYTSRIEDAGDNPRFVVQAADQPEAIIASSATGAWTPVIKQANSIRNRKHSNAASGPDYFGLSQPTVRKMIQELPNAHKCKNYRMQEFEVHPIGIRGRGKHSRSGKY